MAVYSRLRVASLDVALSLTGVAAGEPEEEAKGFIAKQRQSLKTLLTPFSDPSVNARLLSLCVASALCSVATLIHDTYLPVYLQDQLGLSNTKVRVQAQRIGQFPFLYQAKAWPHPSPIETVSGTRLCADLR